MHAARHLDVVFPLAHPGHAAEQVLDRPGHAHEPVGLHLGQVDDAVGVERLARQHHLPGDQGVMEAQLDRQGKVGHFGAYGCRRRRQPRFGRRRGEGAESRRVAIAQAGVPFLQQASHGLENRRMGGDVPFRGRADQHVGLEQDAFAGGGEALDAAQQADSATQRRQHPGIVVIGTGDHGNDGFRGSIPGRAVHGRTSGYSNLW